MEVIERKSSSSRLYPRLRAFSVIFSFLLFYFFIRETLTPKIVTPGQQIFVLAYSLAMAGVFSTGMTRILRGAKTPRWLDSWGKRFLAYFIAALALVGLVAVLPVPHFYKNVLEHSAFFFVLPFCWVGDRQAQTARWMEGPGASPAVEAVMIESGHDVVLSMSRRKAVFLFIGSSAFVAGGWWMHFQAPVVAWACIAFFGLGIPIGLLMLIPGFACLKIQRNGFSMRHFWREYSFLWSEISDLCVVDRVQSKRVAFNVHKAGARRSALIREMYDRDRVLVDNYGLSAPGLCALMETHRAAAAPSH